MNNPNILKLGKFLSLVLRHQPDLIGIQLDPHGWVDIETLLEKCRSYGKPIDRETLSTIVATNNKKRYRISEDGRQIRAQQGHSVSIALEYEAVPPPPVLYHGTAERFLESIFQSGLLRQKRHHVHLSADRDTASQVGRRHGKLAILQVNTSRMVREGYEFFCTPNGVWLTDTVPPEFLTLLTTGTPD